MATRTPNTTMGIRTPQNMTPATEATQADPPKDKPKASKALKDAAKAMIELLNGAGVIDYEKMYGSDFDAFHKVAKDSEGYQGLVVSIMNEDVTDSVAYHKRIKSRRDWARKLAAL